MLTIIVYEQSIKVQVSDQLSLVVSQLDLGAF